MHHKLALAGHVWVTSTGFGRLGFHMGEISQNPLGMAISFLSPLSPPITVTHRSSHLSYFASKKKFGCICTCFRDQTVSN